jgi:ABC-2 type transport system ATP-binding protein
MSKGMQRQAALMLALSTKPKYLLLDEAFDGLDPVMRNVLKSLLIDGIETNGMTVIIASHNLRELEDLCDHVALIHSGKIVFSNSLEKIKNNIHKVQAAFKIPIPEIKFDGLDIVKCKRTGSLMQMIINGDEESILNKINSLEPVFCEIIEPTLEEIFIYEMEAVGYDVKNLLG